MMFSLSNIRVYDKRQTWSFYFVTPDIVYSVCVRGDDITSIPYVLNNIAILFSHNVGITNTGMVRERCFPMLRELLTVPLLSELLAYSASFIRVSAADRSSFSEGARGVHILFENTGLNMILHQNTDKRHYMRVSTSIEHDLRSAYASRGCFETVSFSDC